VLKNTKEKGKIKKTGGNFPKENFHLFYVIIKT